MNDTNLRNTILKIELTNNYPSLFLCGRLFVCGHDWIKKKVMFTSSIMKALIITIDCD